MGAARRNQIETGLRYFMKIRVTENGRKVMSDQIALIRFDDKILRKLHIPGFGISQINELILDNKTKYHHLGLDYDLVVEQEKLEWTA